MFVHKKGDSYILGRDCKWGKTNIVELSKHIIDTGLFLGGTEGAIGYRSYRSQRITYTSMKNRSMNNILTNGIAKVTLEAEMLKVHGPQIVHQNEILFRVLYEAIPDAVVCINLPIKNSAIPLPSAMHKYKQGTIEHATTVISIIDEIETGIYAMLDHKYGLCFVICDVEYKDVKSFIDKCTENAITPRLLNKIHFYE